MEEEEGGEGGGKKSERGSIHKTWVVPRMENASKRRRKCSEGGRMHGTCAGFIVHLQKKKLQMIRR